MGYWTSEQRNPYEYLRPSLVWVASFPQLAVALENYLILRVVSQVASRFRFRGGGFLVDPLLLKRFRLLSFPIILLHHPIHMQFY